jgi:DNA segregation ATPase FtsK/SpoIIIE-like protein
MLDLNAEIKREKPKRKPRRAAINQIARWGIVVCTLCLVLGVCAAAFHPRFIAVPIYGLFGVYAYAVLMLVFFVGLSMIFSRSYSISKGYIICASIMLVSALCEIHLVSTRGVLGDGYSFGEYLRFAFLQITPGGVVFSVPVFILYNIFAGVTGTSIVLGATFLISMAFLTTYIVTKHGENRVIKRKPESAIQNQPSSKYTADRHELSAKVEQKYQELLQKQGRQTVDTGKSRLGLDKISKNGHTPAQPYSSPLALAQIPATEIIDDMNKISTEAAAKFNNGLIYSVPPGGMVPAVPPAPDFQPVQNFAAQTFPPQPTFTPEVNNLLTEYTIKGEQDTVSFTPVTRARSPKKPSGIVAGQTSFDVGGGQNIKPYKPRRYNRPTIDMIRTESTDLSSFHHDAEMKKGMLDAKLKEFGVGANVTGYTVAPAITRFEISLGLGTRAADVYRMENDFQVILGTTSIRMENVAGKNAIGIEVPNKSIGCASIKDILQSKEWQTAKSPLTVAIGKNISDEVVIGDIGVMPHLLVAGSTGSGKSVCINTFLTSLIYRADPNDVKLILVDPKLVELGMYNEIPHMLIPRSIGDVGQAINALKWMQEEMRKRYKTLQEHGLKHVSQYQALPAYQNGQLGRMPYIVMVIDEAADLIYTGKREVEDAVKQLAALGRASGLHIILATQRPSVDVITAVIKANLPVRIGFKTISNGDSRTIINEVGCEKLVGRGDMLFSREGHIQRVQGAFIDEDDARRIMNYIRENNPCEFDGEVQDYIENGPPLATAGAAGGFGDGPTAARNMDPVFIPILRWLVREENSVKRIASIAGVQRQFGLGFGRAGRIIDQMTQMGYVSEDNGQKGRSVLITKDEVDTMYGAE